MSPALHFTIAHQQLELSPEDARRLGISGGEQVEVSQNGTRLRAKAVVRSGVSAGTAFLAEGIAADSANALTGDEIEVGKSEAKPSGDRGRDARGRNQQRRPEGGKG